MKCEVIIYYKNLDDTEYCRIENVNKFEQCGDDFIVICGLNSEHEIIHHIAMKYTQAIKIISHDENERAKWGIFA